MFQLRDGHRFSTDDILTAWYGTSWCPTAQTGLDLGSGIGIDHRPPEEKRKLARDSRAYNKKYLAEITAAFEAQIAENSSEPVANILAARAPRVTADMAAALAAKAIPAAAAAAVPAAVPVAAATPVEAATTATTAASLADAELDAIINGLF